MMLTEQERIDVTHAIEVALCEFGSIERKTGQTERLQTLLRRLLATQTKDSSS